MHIQRLFAIVNLLLAKRLVSADELARHFGVSKRTILRDVQALIGAGVPLYTVQGRGGGIAIMESYVLSRATLGDEEQEQIIYSLHEAKAATQVDSDELLTKLGRFFQRDDGQWIDVDLTRWGSSQPDRERFAIIKQALLDHRMLSFTYVEADGSLRTRLVCPLRLAFSSQAWHLQAYCMTSKGYGAFKVNQMLALTCQDEAFDPGAYSAPAMDMASETSSVLANLELLFTPQVLHRVYDEFDEAQVTLMHDGSSQVRVRLPHDEWLYSFLLSFGVNVRVVKPDSIRMRLADRVAEIAAHLLSDNT